MCPYHVGNHSGMILENINTGTTEQCLRSRALREIGNERAQKYRSLGGLMNWVSDQPAWFPFPSRQGPRKRASNKR